VRQRALARAAGSPRPADGRGVTLAPLAPQVGADSLRYSTVDVTIDRALGAAHLTVHAPTGATPTSPDDLDAGSWLIAAARQLDDAVLRLRFNESEVGTWVLHTRGDAGAVAAAEDLLRAHPEHWVVNEARLLWTRVLKRLDLSARTLVTLVEPGSCFVGVLAELVLAADRSYMLDGPDPDGDAPPTMLRLTDANDGWFPMSNGLSRLATRFVGRDDALADARALVGKDLLAAAALDGELMTFTPDDIDWHDDIRLLLEERNSFSPDALTAMEANHRFAGPETMETKIFARLTAWQNWVFQRPNAVGPDGALQRYGTGSRPTFDRTRV
jgi:benzoyl-CoA-dihydrodiol lyase